jgi:hypothetical protein
LVALNHLTVPVDMVTNSIMQAFRSTHIAERANLPLRDGNQARRPMKGRRNRPNQTG